MAIANLHEVIQSSILRRNQLNLEITELQSQKTLATYSQADAETLLSGGTVKKTNTWKSGKTSENDMKYDVDKNQVSAIFNS